MCWSQNFTDYHIPLSGCITQLQKHGYNSIVNRHSSNTTQTKTAETLRTKEPRRKVRFSQTKKKKHTYTHSPPRFLFTCVREAEPIDLTSWRPALSTVLYRRLVGKHFDDNDPNICVHTYVHMYVHICSNISACGLYGGTAVYLYTCT